jgi:acetyl-CoA acyltransferase
MGHISLGSGVKYTGALGTPWPDESVERYALVPHGIAAERVADHWELSRAELDQLSLRSHVLAAQATDEGRFAGEIVAVNGERAGDQGIRRDTDLAKLATRGPAFEEDGVITAGNSSQVSDGAAAVCSCPRRPRLPMASARGRIVDQPFTGVDPVIMLTGPMSATQVLLERNDLTVDDVDLFEVNEAFAPVVAVWQRETGAHLDRVNVNGGAIALGHPLDASGARLLTTLLPELERGDKQTGLVAMCCAGGIGTGTLVERV